MKSHLLLYDAPGTRLGRPVVLVLLRQQQNQRADFTCVTRQSSSDSTRIRTRLKWLNMAGDIWHLDCDDGVSKRRVSWIAPNMDCGLVWCGWKTPESFRPSVSIVFVEERGQIDFWDPLSGNITSDRLGSGGGEVSQGKRGHSTDRASSFLLVAP